MNQLNPETYALTARCPIDDAARLRALARTRGMTASALVAELVHRVVAEVAPAPEDAIWADQRRQSNLHRRQVQDERTWRGDYRKPGWEQLPSHAHEQTEEK